MIKVRFSQRDNQLADILERLRHLSLAFREEEDRSVEEPELQDSDRKISGNAEIHDYLDEIEGQLGEWWYCSC